MSRQVSERLTPHAVIIMPLADFEQRFGFRPTDALEKAYFAKTGKRLHPMTRSMIQAGLAGPSDVSRVVME